MVGWSARDGMRESISTEHYFRAVFAIVFSDIFSAVSRTSDITE